MVSLLRSRVAARRSVVLFVALFGTGTVGFYGAVHVPRLRQQCKPLPPERQTPLFVAGNETVDALLFGTMKRPRFYALILCRLFLLFAHLVKMLFNVFAAVLRGERIVRDQGNGSETNSMQRALPPDSPVYDSLLCLLKSMGPAYIKMGQWAATRPDLFPESLITKLSELFDSAPAHSWEYTKRELERQGLLDHLENIEPEPLNSGSVGQVHRATLKRSQHVDPKRISESESASEVPIACWWSPSMCFLDRALQRIGIDPTAGVPTDVADLPRGTPVVVKILHPDLRPIILADVAIIRFLAWALSKLPGVEYLSLRQSAKEVAVLLLSQLDLRRECDNLLTFRYNFIGNENVRFPVPVPQLTSSNVLIESFEQGTSILASDVSHPKWAEVAFHAFLKMLLVDNFVHSDLHPGNVLARYREPDGSFTCPKLKQFHMMQHHSKGKLEAQHPPRDVSQSALRLAASAAKAFVHSIIPDCILCKLLPRRTMEFVILDPGLVTSLSVKERTNFVILFTAIATGDGRIAAKLLLDHAPNQCEDVPQFTNEMIELFDVILPKKHGLPTFCFANVQFGFVCTKSFEAMRKHRVRVEGNFATMVASIVVGEGFGRLCDPRFNMLAASVPYLLSYLQLHEMKALFDVLADMYAPDLHFFSRRRSLSTSRDVPNFAPARQAL